jgi:hypothetical protein
MSSHGGKVSWSPYTDDDDAKTTLASMLRATSSTLSVPRTLTSVVSAG